MIDRNPMDKVERPKPRKDEIKAAGPLVYTPAEIQQIITSLEREPLKWQALVHLLIDTGIRRGECCALQWKNIDFDTGAITIARNLCYTSAKGVYLDTPKNGHTRTVYAGGHTPALLRRLRTEQSQKSISSYVFTRGASPEPMHAQSPTRYLKKFSERYAVPDLHPHEALGHSDKAVTLRMYTHADQESISQAAQIVREAIKKAGQG